jgi:hypothetical protein
VETWAYNPLYINTGPAGTPAGTLVASVTVVGAITATAVTLPAGYTRQIQIANQTTAWAFVNFGIVGVVTAATVAGSYPVAPGAVVVVTVADEVTGASVILGTAPGTNTSVTFTRGNGI